MVADNINEWSNIILYKTNLLGVSYVRSVNSVRPARWSFI